MFLHPLQYVDRVHPNAMLRASSASVGDRSRGARVARQASQAAGWAVAGEKVEV